MIPLHFIYNSAIIYPLDAGFFQYHQGNKQFEPRSGRQNVAPDLGPSCLQRYSATLASKKLNAKQLVE